MRQVIPAAVKPALLRYAWALSIAASALALRFALDPLVGQMGFVFLLAGILLTAWVGGVGPCLIAQTVILIVHARYFAVTAHPTWPPTLRSIVNLAAFYAVGLSVAAMSQLAQAARQRARAKTAEAVTQREQLRAILSCMGDGVLVTDASGRVTLMNSMAEMLIGATIAQSRGKPLLGVLPLREADSRRLAADPSAQVIRQQHVIHSTTALVLERERAADADRLFGRPRPGRRRTVDGHRRDISRRIGTPPNRRGLAPPIGAKTSSWPRWPTSSAIRWRRSAWAWS